MTKIKTRMMTTTKKNNKMPNEAHLAVILIVAVVVEEEAVAVATILAASIVVNLVISPANVPNLVEEDVVAEEAEIVVVDAELLEVEVATIPAALNAVKKAISHANALKMKEEEEDFEGEEEAVAVAEEDAEAAAVASIAANLDISLANVLKVAVEAVGDVEVVVVAEDVAPVLIVKAVSISDHRPASVKISKTKRRNSPMTTLIKFELLLVSSMCALLLEVKMPLNE